MSEQMRDFGEFGLVPDELPDWMQSQLPRPRRLVMVSTLPTDGSFYERFMAAGEDKPNAE